MSPSAGLTLLLLRRYSRKAEALRAQGRLDDMKQLYKDCIKRFRKHNMFWKDALQNEFPEASS